MEIWRRLEKKDWLAAGIFCYNGLVIIFSVQDFSLVLIKQFEI